VNILEAEKIIDDFIKLELPRLRWFQESQPDVSAILLYGSVAKGTNRPDSDIDLLVIMPLEIEKKYTEGEYIYRFHGQEINIVIRSIEKLRKIAKGPHDDFQAEIFRESKIIWQRDDEVFLLISKIIG